MLFSAFRSGAQPGARFALFEYGFRIFFLLAGLHGALMIPVWVAVVFGRLELPAQMEVSWHAHQMVYGFAAAGLAGFLLTAVPGWTGTPARRGAPLVALAALWLAGRIGMTFPATFTPWLAAALDLAFIPALIGAILGPLIAAGKARNLILVLPLLAFWAGDVAMQAQFVGLAEDSAGDGARVGIDVLLLLITIIGGRIVPAFTANALQAGGLDSGPRSIPALDRLAIAAMALLVVSEAASGMSPVTGAIALAAAVLSAARLAGWRGERALHSPILWVLHLGYAWLVAGLALKAAAAFTDTVPDTAALHALTVGAIATMLLAVMSRAGLGHTGRPLRAHPAVVAAYLLVSVAALLRIGATLAPIFYTELLTASGAAWSLAFLLFVFVYAPILILPRPDGRPG
jgi:uncharacterized protein involved in response to NO